MRPDAAGCRRFRPRDRLITPAEYRAVFEKPIKSADALFTVLARHNDRDRPRLGLAISKRAARRAVDRNRLKRIARESFRLNRESLPTVDLVVLARAAAVAAPTPALFRSLTAHWRTLANLCDTSRSC